MNNKFKTALLFISKFISNPLQNASIIPSSNHSCFAMLNNIDFNTINTIIELGPGVGNMTHWLLEHCKPGTKIILVEIDKSFVDVLTKRFGSNVIVENESAEHLDCILDKNNVKKADLIISGLPFPPQKIRDKLFNSIKKQTNKGAIFRFFTYMPFFMKKVYIDLPIIKQTVELRNFPPLIVYGIN